VRLPSALFGTLTIAVVYVLGRRLLNRRVGRVAAWMVTVSPIHVRFAQEARMYTLLTLLASLALTAFVRLWRGWGGVNLDECESAMGQRVSVRALEVAGGSWRGWLGYVSFTAAMLWSHNTALFFPAAANLVVLARVIAGRRDDSGTTWRSTGPYQVDLGPDALWMRRWIAAQGAVLILWAPWIPALGAQAADVYQRFWLPTPTASTVLSIIGVLLWDFPSGVLLIPLLVSTTLGAATLYGLFELRRSLRGQAWIGVFFLVPLAAQSIVSARRPILAEQTMIWTSIPLYLMLAVGIAAISSKIAARLPTGLLRSTPLITLIVVQVVGVGAYHGSPGKEAWDDAAALVAERLAPDDVLLFSGAWGQIPFDYYLARTYNRADGPQVAEHGLPVDLFDRGVLEPEMTEQDLGRLNELIAGRSRVWLISSHAWYTDPEGLVSEALESALTLKQCWALEGVEVRLYDGG